MGLQGKSKLSNDGYTQREWDRVVGWGKVPEEYKHDSEKEELEEYVEHPKDNNLFENKEE